MLWRSTTTTAAATTQRRRRSTTKSVTPTFQVDDLHCIVDARARHGPHLDTGRPSSLHRHSPPPGRGWRSAAGGGGEEERTNPSVACHYSRLKIVWLVTVNLWRGCILIALSLRFSFLSFFEFRSRGDEAHLASLRGGEGG